MIKTAIRTTEQKQIATMAGIFGAEALSTYFDGLSSRDPASTPDQVRGRLSLQNA
jgi:hypothetical protein